MILVLIIVSIIGLALALALLFGWVPDGRTTPYPAPLDPDGDDAV